MIIPSITFAQTAEIPSVAQLTVGTTWEWQQFDSRTKVVEGKETRTVINADGVLRISALSEGSLVRPSSYPKDFSIAEIFTIGNNLPASKLGRSWPLEVGKKYKTDVDWSRLDGVTGNTKLDAEVVGYEEVTVPAGKFMAFKIEQKGMWQNSRPRSGYQKITCWYAPDVYADVKCTSDDGFNVNTREMISYKHGMP
jgi:hypothetical protein